MTPVEKQLYSRLLNYLEYLDARITKLESVNGTSMDDTETLLMQIEKMLAEAK